MHAISPIQVIKNNNRAARCGKTGESARANAAEVRQLQAELTHLRFELQTLKQATQQFVRQML